MEISKLTICRQDVIVVSDTETNSCEVNSNKKKKHKRKTECVRNVKLTTMTVNRIVPNCFRQRCRSGQGHHRQISKNTKYQRREVSPAETRYKKSKSSVKSMLHERDKNDDDMVARDLSSPITIASSTDTYENVSSCSLDVQSSDSDELEDLINITRKRMKNDSGNFKSYQFRKTECSTTTQDDYQNISSNDEVHDSSIHSMDTVVLYHGDTISSRKRPELNQFNLNKHNNNNNNILPKILNTGTNQNNNAVLQQKVPSLSSQDNNDSLSPFYEISGKVFMEHYLNTSII